MTSQTIRHDQMENKTPADFRNDLTGLSRLSAGNFSVPAYSADGIKVYFARSIMISLLRLMNSVIASGLSGAFAIAARS